MLRLSSAQAFAFFIASVISFPAAFGQPIENLKYGQADVFRQLEEWLPTPNVYRAPNGAPGPQYWQQKADYVIEATLDDAHQSITGKEKISYHNHSPHPLSFVWLQLDQNMYSPNSMSRRSATSPDFGDRVPFGLVRNLLYEKQFDGGHKITKVTDGADSPLHYTIVDTMMRVDLAEPLPSDGVIDLKIEWHFNIVDAKRTRSRGGYEYFKDDKNYIYEIAQWFPRMVAFTDATGWQHKQYLGQGEFALTFGNYDVKLTVPADHIVGATGELRNAEEVLTEAQRERLQQAIKADKPTFIVTPDEAKTNEKSDPGKATKTWHFMANDVRDFAFASSRKFIWDAQGHELNGDRVMAMSFYPKEAEPLWSQYSTHSIIHTLNVYSRYTFNYPYPVAISVNGPIYGMEYPMICFNGPRPESDGTYSERTKYGLISVIIHEVGHNYFPMIVNSDERQWFWMDEGLNTFLQYLAEQEWETDYPSQRGEPSQILGYMLSQDQVPIMTAADSVLQVGPNAYWKPATALNILRETVMGRELFDFAFKEYAKRWKFKHPQPADFFRTMEDASGMDLDWFWRGWFYGTEHVDIAITTVKQFQIDAGDPDAEAARKRKEDQEKPPSVSKERNAELPKRIEAYPELNDFYNKDDPYAVTDRERETYQSFLKGLDDDQRKLIHDDTNFYVITFENEGGLISPIIFDAVYEDGSHERFQIPAEIWRRNSQEVRKLWMTDKKLLRVELDPQRQMADTNRNNNHFPPKIESSRFKMFKDEQSSGENAMQRAKKAAEKKTDEKKVDEKGK